MTTRVCFSLYVMLLAEVLISEGSGDAVSVIPLKSPRDINDGFCGDFSDQLMDDATAAGVLDVVPCEGFELSGDVVDGEHLWSYWRGRHYDAEAPEGVEDWRDLPFWLRRERLMGRRIRLRGSRASEKRHLEASALFLSRGRMDLARMAAAS